MTTEDFGRELTAILSADVKGYSRLMSEDEEGTIRTLTAYREVLASLIRKHRGRVVDSPGDNVLAEFRSVVDAVRCGVEVQKELKARNTELPENRRMEFRIGVNLGDVIKEGSRIYGDGVNIASRVEGLAEGGGVCISGTVYESVKNKLTLGYENLGEQTVKNISEPIRVYRVLMEPEVAGKVTGEKRPGIKRWQWMTLSAALVVVAVVGIWYLVFRPSYPSVEPASVERMAFPLPEKPSIAVLPFENLSDDPEQEYFVDGMTDDLITDLSSISGVFVIARNSTFIYKGKPVKIRQVAEELGVRYVLEGSVRKAGDRVRINAQLIDSTTGGHLWAKRYDGKMGDVLPLQDKITEKIIAALAVKLTSGEGEHITRKETDDIEAYDAFLQGWAHYVRRTPDEFAKAVRYFEKAIELDPDYGWAYAALATTYWEGYHKFWHASLGVSWSEARYLAEKYLREAMGNPRPLAHQVASRISITHGQCEKGLAEAEHAIALDPNDPNSYLTIAWALISNGRPKEAVDSVKRAMRLDPEYSADYLFVLGLAYFGMEQFEEAATLFERALKRNPEDYYPLFPLSAAYAHLDREEEAKGAIAELKKSNPAVSVTGFMGYGLWRYKNPNDMDRLVDGLIEAGLEMHADPRPGLPR